MGSGFQTAPSRFQIQRFDDNLVAAQLDARGLDDIAEARDLLADIREDLGRLRREKLALTGERADATQTLIDAGQAYLDGAAARLMVKAEANDADALRRLLTSARRIRATLRGEHPVDDAINNVTQTAADVAKDARAAAEGFGNALPWIFGVALIGVGVYVYVNRAALGASLKLAAGGGL